MDGLATLGYSLHITYSISLVAPYHLAIFPVSINRPVYICLVGLMLQRIYTKRKRGMYGTEKYQWQS